MSFRWRNTIVAYKSYGDEIRRDLATELIQRGHVASGNLLNSLAIEIDETKKTRTNLNIKTSSYGKDLDEPIKNGAKMVNRWTALSIGRKFNWMAAKGIDATKGNAIAITTNMRKRGFPKFAETPNFKGWISTTFDKFEPKAVKELTPAIIKDVSEAIDMILSQAAAKNQNITYKK